MNHEAVNSACFKKPCLLVNTRALLPWKALRKQRGKIASSAWVFMSGYFSRVLQREPQTQPETWVGHDMFLLAHSWSLDHLETSDFYALHRNILQFISYYKLLVHWRSMPWHHWTLRIVLGSLWEEGGIWGSGSQGVYLPGRDWGRAPWSWVMRTGKIIGECHCNGHLLCSTWRRKWQPTPVFLPGKSSGQRSPWGRKELDKTEVTKL